MIDFRYHVISIVAVFLALATGLVLGASLLNTQLLDTQNDQNQDLIDDKNELRAELDALEGERESLEQFVTAVGPLAVRDLLVGQRVMIVALPGAVEGEGQEMLDGITAQLLAAGAADVVGSVAINEAWTDEGDAGVLDGLVAQLTQEEIDLPEGTAYDRAAVLLAHALMRTERGDDTGEDPGGETGDPGSTEEPPTTESPATTTPGTTEPGSTDGPDGPADPDDPEPPSGNLSGDEITTILEGLSAGGFIAFDDPPSSLADVAVVLAPPAPDADEGGELAADAWTRVAVALDDVGSASVVAGPASAAEAGGLIAALRGDETASAVVSTVDSAVDSPGQVAAVVALAAELAGQTGHYGRIGDVDGPLPVLTGADAG